MTKTLKTKKAPNIKVPSTNGETFELKKIKNKYVVLYFYPKDDTPGCTLETKILTPLTKFKIGLCSFWNFKMI